MVSQVKACLEYYVRYKFTTSCNRSNSSNENNITDRKARLNRQQQQQQLLPLHYSWRSSLQINNNNNNNNNTPSEWIHFNNKYNNHLIRMCWICHSFILKVPRHTRDDDDDDDDE